MLTISKIAALVFQPAGATLSQVTKSLAVSRTTAIRWLSLMESGELLSRTQLLSGRRGRPEAVYRPTDRLTRLIEAHSSDSIAVLNFPVLRQMCKYFVKGSCGYRVETQLCAASLCPFLQMEDRIK
jgi:predicted ArsR family transcriptional regulator